MDDDSVLKEKPLRYAGQSLDEELDRISNDEAVAPFAGVAAAYAFCLGIWTGWFFGSWAHALFATVLLFPLTIWATLHVRKQMKLARNMRQGRDGERRVGQLLECLRADGYVIFHDVVADNFNVDHVVVGPSGIFAVETKTWGSSGSRKHKIEFNGREVRNLDSATPIWDKSPIDQASRQATYVAGLIERVTGTRDIVIPVVLFVDRYVSYTENTSKVSVEVLNPKMLQGRLRKMPSRLTSERIRQIELQLTAELTKQ